MMFDNLTFQQQAAIRKLEQDSADLALVTAELVKVKKERNALALEIERLKNQSWWQWLRGKYAR